MDSARAGEGALFPLAHVRPGATVCLSTAGGDRYVYRAVSVRSYPKNALPLGVFSASGPARLVVVTCGGPFDSAAGHYLENVVVTASPVR